MHSSSRMPLGKKVLLLKRIRSDKEAVTEFEDKKEQPRLKQGSLNSGLHAPLVSDGLRQLNDTTKCV